LTGSAAHVGIGSDFDGGFGSESIPQGIDTVTDLLEIGKGLAERGFSEADVEAVMSGNMLRKLRHTCSASCGRRSPPKAVLCTALLNLESRSAHWASS